MNTNLNLTLLDKLVLLALDDEKGSFVADSMTFGYCIAGAALFELSIQDRIRIIDNRIKITNKMKLNDEVLDYCMEIIADSKKDRKINHWIEALGNKAGKMRRKTLDKLIALDILEEKENKILWVFTSKKYPTKNETPENLIRKRLLDIINKRTKAEVDEIMIISLVDVCGLNKEVYGKEMAKKRAKDIKSIIKDYPFADTTSKLIKEIHDTITAVIIMVVATAAITTTASS